MFRAAVLAGCVLTLSFACSAPPDKERHQAEGAIAAARAAGAAVYAPQVLAQAEAALAGYDRAVADRDYREALRLALEARDTAFQATGDAGDAKAAQRSRAEQLMTEAAALLAELEARPAPRRTDTASGLVANARTALQEAGSKLDAADYNAAAEALQALVIRLRGETAPAPRASS